MEKIVKIIIVGTFALMALISTFAGWVYYEFSYKPEKAAAAQLLKQNPQITKVYSVYRVSGWGSIPEYTAIVRVEKESCRVWIDDYGSLTGSECNKNLQ